MSVFKKLIRIFTGNAAKLGEEGEQAAAEILCRVRIRGQKGKLLRNVYVPVSSGKTAEIDLLYITRKGIFVVESKNYAGYIFGEESDQNWTAVLFSGRNRTEKHSFYNPVLQNRTHAACLKRYLQTEIPLFSIIVFSNRGELRRVSWDSPDLTVCRQEDLSREIRRLCRGRRNCLTAAQTEALYRRLLPLTQVSGAVKKQHIRDVRSRNCPEKTGICPLCGGTLVLRTARSGAYAGQQFYGCSNYPRCRYIRDIGEPRR